VRGSSKTIEKTMRQIKMILISFFVFCLTFPMLLNAQVWKSRGPDGGIIGPWAIDPSAPATVYAGTQWGGVLKTIDTGSSWQAVNAVTYAKG
jgi:hypothetical protein